MKNTLLFVVDLGHFKAFQIIDDQTSSRARLSVLEDFELEGSHMRLSEKLTDQSGRRSGNSTGERNNIDLEFERRAQQILVNRIVAMCRQESELPEIYFAAPKEIHHQLMNRLPADLRSCVTRSIPENLANLPHNQLLEHCQEMSAPAMAGQ